MSDADFHAAAQWPDSGLERVIACPVCDSEERQLELNGLIDSVFGSAPGHWSLFRCAVCRCAYLDPRPDRDSIGLAYGSYYTHAPAPSKVGLTWVMQLRASIANSYRNRMFGTQLRPALPGGWWVAALAKSQAHSLLLDGRGMERMRPDGDKLLDVGCGNGSFLAIAKQAGWNCYGVEPDERAVKIAEADGISILGADLTEIRDRYTEEFKVITLNHVIEHLHDPNQTLRDCWNMLKPGGFVWLETPNIDSVGYDIYSRSWRGLEPPRHLVLFSRNGLMESLTRAGFADIEILAPRDAIAYTFSRSAYASAGSLSEVNPTPLTSAEMDDLKANISRARRLVCIDSLKSEFITAVARKPETLTHCEGVE